MSIKCPECGKEVNEVYTVCPWCGCPLGGNDGASSAAENFNLGIQKINGYISKMVNSRNRINEKIIFLHVSNTEEICDLMHSFLD